MDISSAYRQRQTPEYCQAFNLATQRCQGADGVLAVVSSVAWAVELLRRVASPLTFYSSGTFTATDFTLQAKDWAIGSVAAHDPASGQSFEAVIWAEPERGSLTDVVRRLTACARPGATLVVLHTTPLGGLLPAGQRRDRPARQPVFPPIVCRLLQRHGWEIEQRLALHGPRSIACSLLGRAAGLAGRSDWHDRCIFTMHGVFQEPAWLWPLATASMTFLIKGN